MRTDKIILNKQGILKLILITVSYFLLAYISSFLFDPAYTFFTIRLAPALGLIATLLYGFPALLAVFIGELFYVYFQYHSELPIFVTISLAVAAVLYAYIGTSLIRKYIDPPYQLTHSLDCYKYILISGFIASLIPSYLGALSISLVEPAVQHSYWLLATHWWLGQTLGVLIISPIIFCFLNKSVPIWQARFPLAPILTVMLLGFVAVIYAYVTIKENEKLESILQQESVAINSAVKLQMSSYEEALFSLKNLFEYAPDLEPLEFEVFSKKIMLRQPSIHALAYQQLIKADERKAYESKMRDIYSSKFQIKERNEFNKFIRAGERESYTPITMRSVFEKDAVILGFDTSTSDISKGARLKAIETGKVSITHAFTLVSTVNNLKSIVLYLALEDDGLFSGYVSLSVYVGHAIQSAIDTVNLENISTRMWDAELIEKNIIFSKEALNYEDYSGPKIRGKIKFSSHDWIYELVPDSIYLSQILKSQLLIIIFCIILSGILLVRLLEFTGKGYKLGLRVAESEARFKGAFTNTPIGMAIVSLKHNIIDANRSLCEMLGYSKDDLESKFFSDITYSDDLDVSLEQHTKLINKEIDHYAIEKRYVHKNGSVIWVLLSVSLTCDNEGTPLYGVAQIQDITRQKEHAIELNYLATHDPLTELVNRREFERRTERLLSTIERAKTQHALCYIDLDQFKIINDTCGHNAGDEMLRQLSAILQNTVRQSDSLARLGGDEFGVLMERCSIDNAHRVCKTLLEAIQDFQFSWEQYSFKIGASMGLVPITINTINMIELLKHADAACYQAKDQGRNRIHVYRPEDAEIAQRHGEMQWVTRINKALDENRFCLYAQPILCLDENTKKHYEILLRMIDERGNIVQPNAFLPAAERYDLISKIDYWVIENAISLLTSNPVFIEQIDFCSINISGSSLSEPDILNFIIDHLSKSELDGKQLCFEITETVVISNMVRAMKFISTLKGLGCKFALDDFGSGLSSFAYLKNLPVDFLKIDGVFVKDIVDDPIDHAMVKSINEIGHVMGMKTIAEFVENDEIKGMLREIGVNYAQGYGIGKPEPLDVIINRVNNLIDFNDLKKQNKQC